jgi:glycosyltransferase involved in cell wall biosynthesis
MNKLNQSSDLCILIPTYNNEKTLKSVIDAVLLYCSDIIVVNDGSTDGTTEILNAYIDTITVLSYPKNKGKGYALKTGLREARQKGFRYVLTLDSDGQHYAEDIPNFVKTIQKHPDTLLIGSRNLNQPNMKQGSKYANRLSNFWFTVQTGKILPDTQTGYRLYPIWEMKKILPFCSRYEAEIELLVRCAWKGIRLIAIPIQVFYPTKEERVSHFRPSRDFLRISLLNTLLCVLAVVYGYPSLLYHKIFKAI